MVFWGHNRRLELCGLEQSEVFTSRITPECFRNCLSVNASNRWSVTSTWKQGSKVQKPGQLSRSRHQPSQYIGVIPPPATGDDWYGFFLCYRKFNGAKVFARVLTEIQSTFSWYVQPFVESYEAEYLTGDLFFCRRSIYIYNIPSVLIPLSYCQWTLVYVLWYIKHNVFAFIEWV